MLGGKEGLDPTFSLSLLKVHAALEESPVLEIESLAGEWLAPDPGCAVRALAGRGERIESDVLHGAPSALS